MTDLIEWIKQNDINEDSIFQVSRNVATLLLLATGRRVHDLTLLDVGEHFFEDGNTSVKFWPRHGSKTDSSTYTQSGWEITRNPNKNLDLVYWIQRLLQVTQSRRGSLSSLFLTTRGSTKPASRSVIAGWVRTLFKQAGITATPGSCRSAVASDNWVNQRMDLEDVLKKGNWRKEDTFLKHYFRVINPRASQNNTVSISCDFSPI